MRKITREAYSAFCSFQSFKKDNTEVFINRFTPHGDIRQLILHGHIIAEHNDEGLFIDSCGWNTNTTRERLSPFARISTKKGQMFLNGEKWNGERIKIS